MVISTEYNSLDGYCTFVSAISFFFPLPDDNWLGRTGACSSSILKCLHWFGRVGASLHYGSSRLLAHRFPSHIFSICVFQSDPPAESNAIVRQAMWVGFYGATLAWLQLGHLITLWAWMGLAGGLIAIESLIRWRERARWRLPTLDSEPPMPRLSISNFQLR